MNKKIILIISDGLRPDSVSASNHPCAKKLLSGGKYTLAATTVMPSVTLPCHMSLFHSVTPQRHGILTNTYTPQVRPVRGICEVLSAAGKVCGMFYNWEELRDLTRPGSIARACFESGRIYGYEVANSTVTAAAINYINTAAPDFTFVYLGLTDEIGHRHGWLSDEYNRAVDSSFECVEQIIDGVSDEYIIILTSDHGGHDRSHGSDMPEDMTIPVIFYNKSQTVIAPGTIEGDINIIDIAPTIAAGLGVAPDNDWEGRVFAL